MAGFFDKVVVGINKGVNTVSEGSKMIVEKANINTQIREIEKEKSNLLRDMGTLVYNLQTGGEISVAQCEGLCSEIAARENQIAALTARLAELETPKKPMPYGQAPAAESDATGVPCACGAVNREGAKFCATCGKQI